jgi:hypothetical protein
VAGSEGAGPVLRCLRIEGLASSVCAMLAAEVVAEIPGVYAARVEEGACVACVDSVRVRVEDIAAALQELGCCPDGLLAEAAAARAGAQ